MAQTEYFVPEVDTLQPVDLIEFFGDAKFIADFEWP